MRVDWTGKPANGRQWSRCIVVGGGSSYGVIGHNMVEGVEQGIDITGGDGPQGTVVIGNTLRNIGTWGIKAANSGRRILVAANMVTNVGYAGIVISGAVTDLTLRTADCVVDGNIVIDPGFMAPGVASTWTSGQACGVLVQENSTIDVTYPRGVQVQNCYVTAPGGRMDHGYRNTVTTAIGGTAEANWLQNCVSEHHLVAVQTGFGFPNAIIRGNAGTEVFPASTWSEMSLDTTTYDPAQMHDVSDDKNIRVKQPGFYIAHVVVTWPTDTTGLRKVRLLKNGGTITLAEHVMAPVAGEPTIQQWMFPVGNLAVNEAIRMQIWHSASASLTVTRTSCHLALMRTNSNG